MIANAKYKLATLLFTVVRLDLLATGSLVHPQESV